jgi:hypothetical protein
MEVRQGAVRNFFEEPSSSSPSSAGGDACLRSTGPRLYEHLMRDPAKPSAARERVARGHSQMHAHHGEIVQGMFYSSGHALDTALEPQWIAGLAVAAEADRGCRFIYSPDGQECTVDSNQAGAPRRRAAPRAG